MKFRLLFLALFALFSVAANGQALAPAYFNAQKDTAGNYYIIRMEQITTQGGFQTVNTVSKCPTKPAALETIQAIQADLRRQQDECAKILNMILTEK